MSRPSMGRRESTQADEADAFSRFRHFLNWAPGERSAIKRRARRRDRHAARLALRKDLDQ